MLRKKKQTPQEQSDQEFNLALEVPAEQRPKGWRPFVRRNWKRIAAAACAAAVAGAFLLPGKGAKPAGVDTEYLESAVERRNITNVFSGSGTIAAANTYTVNALVSGTVLTADFAVGDTIEEGTVLYTIDSSNAANSVEKAQLSLDQAQRNYEDAVDAQYVRSTIGGTLASYKVAVGDVVTAGQEVATVRDASTLLLTLEFPAADARTLPRGRPHRSRWTAPLSSSKPMWMPMPTRIPAAFALPVRQKSSAGLAWSMAGRAMVPIRQSISSAACVPWMSRGTGWSMLAAPKRTACPWRCTTA